MSDENLQEDRVERLTQSILKHDTRIRESMRDYLEQQPPPITTQETLGNMIEFLIRELARVNATIEEVQYQATLNSVKWK